MSSKVPGVHITGGRETRKQFEELGEAAVDELKAVNLEGAEIVSEAALALVPVMSGTLYNTIRAAATKTRGSVRAGFKSRAPYAGRIHFGDPGGRTGKRIRPNPFLYNAMDKRRDEVAIAYEDHIKKLKKKHGL